MWTFYNLTPDQSHERNLEIPQHTLINNNKQFFHGYNYLYLFNFDSQCKEMFTKEMWVGVSSLSLQNFISND